MMIEPIEKMPALLVAEIPSEGISEMQSAWRVGGIQDQVTPDSPSKDRACQGDTHLLSRLQPGPDERCHVAASEMP